MTSSYKIRDVYSDPTTSTICSVACPEFKTSDVTIEPPKVYICSPYRGDIDTNIANARRYCRYAVGHGKFPIAPHLLLPQFLDDNVPAERELALSFGLRLLYDCSAIWVCGYSITEGMRCEIDAAVKHGIKIRYISGETGDV